jgi:hypothetical protein
MKSADNCDTTTIKTATSLLDKVLEVGALITVIRNQVISIQPSRDWGWTSL